MAEISEKTELQRLIDEQAKDDRSRYVHRQGREVILEPGLLVKMADDIQAKHEHHSRISWGEPAQIAAEKEELL